MKTIFITAFHPFISKNILNTDVFKILEARNDLKIILLVPSARREFFETNYSSQSVAVEGIDTAQFSNSRSNSFFSWAAFFFIYSFWIRRKRRDYLNAHWGIYNFIKFHSFMILTWLLSGHKSINRIFRNLDWRYSPSDFFKKQYDHYKPNLVFSTDIYTDFDQAVIKEAKMRKIRTIGMVRSWDNNFSKGLCRFMPDKLIVNNETIRQEAIELHDFKEENIFIGGLPQFDDYLKAPFQNREEYFKSIRGDPGKKTVLFAPGSPEEFGGVNLMIPRALKEAKQKGILPKDVQFLISNHPHRPNDFSEFSGEKDFAVIWLGTKLGGRENVEFSPENSKQLADMVYYADIVIWMASSIGLDALVFSKPEIVINFDGLESRPYWKSVRRFHDEDHMRAFFKTGGIKMAKKLEDVIQFVGEYLQNPHLDEEGRSKAREQQLWKVDGKSGERIANFVLSFLS